MKFKSKVRFTEKELKKILIWLQEWSDYRGGMLSRVDGLDIKNAVEGKLRYIKRKKKEQKQK